METEWESHINSTFRKEKRVEEIYLKSIDERTLTEETEIMDRRSIVQYY